ncbi:hypothetical protein Csa_022177 [Cucumis sativus]|uniref:Uncharacterized protein n=1 Tax=Cucumis sativus TaxID=3659 RepID=A0A0A0LQE3_CUCSA|nr:hypothetical protein Csa_022177 [Cucumis sativus]
MDAGRPFARFLIYIALEFSYRGLVMAAMTQKSEANEAIRAVFCRNEIED